ncbi:hypothetical protein D5S18_10805 [Nocardia panacis]|uniref:DUF4175 domain-containing protein n=1 Tax=Nocardia panacis TaxID=2340916 RepID=A0A3A4KA83_9NOCA|nr:hypothetical protein [Nocardia panacis]RJO76740.1 hypothetical protein D5S18_10805 [Nocardia panacis]
MDHSRILRTVLAVSAGYLIILACWLGWLVRYTPPDTVPYQIFALVGLFGSALGLGMLLAARPSKADRKLWRDGLEGWATIEGAHPIERTDHHTTLTEFDLELTVPGSESYRGTIVFDVTPADSSRLTVGGTISIRVDPENRDRIIVCL